MASHAVFDSEEKRLALGHFPATSIKAARTARDDARTLQQQGIDQRSGAFSTSFLREASGQVLRCGIATGRCERNPAFDCGLGP